MVVFNIWLLLMPFMVISFIFGFGILFVRKKYRLWFKRFRYKQNSLDIIMITKNKNVFHGVIKIVQGKFKYNDEEYLIDEEAIYTEKFALAQRPYSFYLEGNPKPLIFNFGSNKPTISSLDLKAFTQSKLIQQLLETKEEMLSKIILIILIVIAIGLVILGYMLIEQFDLLTITLEGLKR